MSPTPDELDRMPIRAWRVLIQSQLRHLNSRTDKRLRNHELRLIRLETRVAVYSGLAGGAVSAAVTILLHVLR